MQEKADVIALRCKLERLLRWNAAIPGG